MDFTRADPEAFRSELAALAEENQLHGDLLESALAACLAGQHADVCDEIRLQPIVLSDFELLEPLRSNPNPETRSSCARCFARFGTIAEPTLIEMLIENGRSYDYEFGVEAADALQDIGTDASLAPLFEIATSPESKGRHREAAKEALLTIEARLGPLPNRPRCAALWDITPERDHRPKFDALWQMAAEDRLHGEVLEAAFENETENWPRRQVLFAAYEQETDLRDLPHFLKAARFKNGAIRDTAFDCLWRFGGLVEDALIEFLDDNKRRHSATRCLQRIGTFKSFRPLIAHGAAARTNDLPGSPYLALEVIAARLRGQGNSQ